MPHFAACEPLLIGWGLSVTSGDLGHLRKREKGTNLFFKNRSVLLNADAHLTVQPLTVHRIKICLVAQINGITTSPDIIIIEFTAFDEHEAMASVKTI
jgi:hypothetical protein